MLINQRYDEESKHTKNEDSSLAPCLSHTVTMAANKSLLLNLRFELRHNLNVNEAKPNMTDILKMHI